MFVARHAVIRLHFAHARAEVTVHSLSSIHRLVPATTATGGRELTIGVMNEELEHLLDVQDGVATSGQILACLNRWAFEKELRTGSLQRMWQGIYCRGEPTDALRLAGVGSVVRHHRRRLSRHGRRDCSASIPRSPPICMCSIRRDCQLRSVDGLVVHRRGGCAAERGRRQAGDLPGLDGGRGRTQSAASPGIGDAWMPRCAAAPATASNCGGRR